MAKNAGMELGAGLIKKGQARGVEPSVAAAEEPSVAVQEPEEPTMVEPEPTPPPQPTRQAPPPPRAEAPPARPAPAQAPVTYDAIHEDHAPLRPVPAMDVPKRFTSFRLPVDLDEELRAMVYETRRSKQDLLEEFVRVGIQGWRRDRARR